MFAASKMGDLLPAVPAKGGHNDLSRWRAFGGTLDRPSPPGRMICGAELREAAASERSERGE